jgi:hypothetical protein
MEYPVPHRFFERQRLTVRAAGLFRGAALLLDGRPVRRQMGKYVLKDDAGNDTAIRLTVNPVDPIPVVRIGSEAIRLAPALIWYEYVWIGIPALLIFVGGALGGALGFAAAYSNSRVFRGGRDTGSKYLLTGLTTVAALLIFVVLAVCIQVAAHMLGM